MNRKIFLLALPFLLLGCGKQQPKGEYVEDIVGRKVSLKAGGYKKIVCVGAGALRLYAYMGNQDLLCGVEDIDNTSLSSRPKMFDGVARPYLMAYEDIYKKLPSCGVGGPNNQKAEDEKIMACEPDLIISEYEDAALMDALQEKTGATVITVGYGPKGVYDAKLSRSFDILGKVLNKKDRAEELKQYIAKSKEDIQERVKDIKKDEQKGVYICGLGNWGTTNHLQTAKNYEPFNIANINNIIDEEDLAIPTGIQPIDEEKFVSLGEKMDVMILDAAAIKNIIPLYKNDPTMFDSCKAWNDGEIYLEMAYNAYYTNIELSISNTWFAAKSVYPDLFEDVDMEAITDEVCEKFLGKKLYSSIKEKPQSYGGYSKLDKSIFNS